MLSGFSKRLDTILLRHQIQKFPDSPSTRYRIRCGYIYFSPLWIRCRIRRLQLGGSPFRMEVWENEKFRSSLEVKKLRRNPREDGAISGFSGQKSVPE